MVNLVTDNNRTRPTFLKKLDKLPEITNQYERNRVYHPDPSGGRSNSQLLKNNSKKSIGNAK